MSHQDMTYVCTCTVANPARYTVLPLIVIAMFHISRSSGCSDCVLKSDMGRRHHWCVSNNAYHQSKREKRESCNATTLNQKQYSKYCKQSRNKRSLHIPRAVTRVAVWRTVRSEQNWRMPIMVVEGGGNQLRNDKCNDRRRIGWTVNDWRHNLNVCGYFWVLTKDFWPWPVRSRWPDQPKKDSKYFIGQTTGTSHLTLDWYCICFRRQYNWTVISHIQRHSVKTWICVGSRTGLVFPGGALSQRGWYSDYYDISITACLRLKGRIFLWTFFTWLIPTLLLVLVRLLINVWL